MKKILFLLLITITSVSLDAQKFQISGKVIDKNEKLPVISAKVILSNIENNATKGVVTDENGLFSITDIENATYNLTISSIGMDSVLMKINELSADLDLGIIEMEPSAQLLKSLEVSGKSIVNQADRQLYFISNEQRKLSSNGVNLIIQMNIPKLFFDPVKNAITSVDKKSVQLRINDVPAENSDILAIQPKDIIRVEYIDNPGLRYGTDVGYVLNYIVQKRASGGSAGVDLNNSVNRIFGRNNLNVKVNHNKSEFSANYFVNYLNLGGLKRINKETFRFENGTERIREEIGIPSNLKEMYNNASLNYNYTEPDKRTINARIRYFGNGTPSEMSFISQSFWQDTPEMLIDMQDMNTSQTQAPSVNLYYLEKLKNDQTLIFDMYYTKRLSREERTYSEKQNGNYLTDIHSNVKGDRDSYIGEMMYEKKFKTTKLTAGFKHQQSYTTNTYYGDMDVKTNMVEAVSYLYSEFSGKKDKLNYTLGIGISRSNIIQKNGKDRSLTDVFFRPRINLNYKINDLSNVRLRTWMYNETPSLSQLSNVCQSIDALQRQCGNPDLKAWISTFSEISYNYNSKIFDFNGSVSYWSRHKPVMEETRRADNLFIRTFENQKYWRRFVPEISLGLRPLKDYLILKVSGGLNQFLSVGNSYRHSFSSFYHTEQVTFNYKKMSFSFINYANPYWFFGETAEAEESLHLLDFSYNTEKFSFGAMVFSPFTKTYKRDSQNLSEFAPREHEWYSNKIQGLVMLKFAYNLRWGADSKASSKRINNEDNESGILKGGK